jgi:16S rRNA (cytidine1402-2'-O)-methyltransferase
MLRFYFGGFLPRKGGERRRELEALASLDATLVFYESPRRSAASLAAIAEVFPARQTVLARELTKLHEEVVRGTAQEVAAEIAGRESLKGEVVLLVGPPSGDEPKTVLDPVDIRARVDALVGQGMSRSAAVRQVAVELGAGRAEVYAIAHR